MVRAGLKEVRRKTKAKREAREMAEVVAAAVVVVSLGGKLIETFYLLLQKIMPVFTFEL